MKNTFLISLILLLVYSCASTINQSKFQNYEDAKAKVISKYGQPTEIEKTGSVETWNYEYKSVLKNNRRVVFSESNKIIQNEKYLKGVPYALRYGFIYGVVPTAVGVGLLLFAFSGF